MNIKIEPRKKSDRGGFLLMPLVSNIPHPKSEDWKKTTCPACGAECWERELPLGYSEDMISGKLCTLCGIKEISGGKKDD